MSSYYYSGYVNVDSTDVYTTSVRDNFLGVDGDTFRLTTAKTPSSAAASGFAGEICWDSGYVYVCTATDTWKRAALATW
jgi:hypothetical protein